MGVGGVKKDRAFQRCKSTVYSLGLHLYGVCCGLELGRLAGAPFADQQHIPGAWGAKGWRRRPTNNLPDITLAYHWFDRRNGLLSKSRPNPPS